MQECWCQGLSQQTPACVCPKHVPAGAKLLQWHPTELHCRSAGVQECRCQGPFQRTPACLCPKLAPAGAKLLRWQPWGCQNLHRGTGPPAHQHTRSHRHGPACVCACHVFLIVVVCLMVGCFGVLAPAAKLGPVRAGRQSGMMKQTPACHSGGLHSFSAAQASANRLAPLSKCCFGANC